MRLPVTVVSPIASASAITKSNVMRRHESTCCPGPQWNDDANESCSPAAFQRLAALVAGGHAHSAAPEPLSEAAAPALEESSVEAANLRAQQSRTQNTTPAACWRSHDADADRENTAPPAIVFEAGAQRDLRDQYSALPQLSPSLSSSQQRAAALRARMHSLAPLVPLTPQLGSEACEAITQQEGASHGSAMHEAQTRAAERPLEHDLSTEAGTEGETALQLAMQAMQQDAPPRHPPVAATPDLHAAICSVSLAEASAGRSAHTCSADEAACNSLRAALQRSRPCAQLPAPHAGALPADDVAPSDSVTLVHCSEAVTVQPQMAVDAPIPSQLHASQREQSCSADLRDAAASDSPSDGLLALRRCLTDQAAAAAQSKLDLTQAAEQPRIAAAVTTASRVHAASQQGALEADAPATSSECTQSSACTSPAASVLTAGQRAPRTAADMASRVPEHDTAERQHLSHAATTVTAAALSACATPVRSVTPGTRLCVSVHFVCHCCT